MPNVERLHAVLDHIKTLPNAVKLNLDNNYAVPMWDQRKWMALPDNTMIEGSCGTAGCFAGWAVMLFVPEFTMDLRDQTNGMIHNVIIDGEVRSIEETARQLLDLNGYEADALFEYSNELDDIEAVIGKIIAGTYDPEYGEYDPEY